MTRFELFCICGFYVYIMFMIGAFNWSLVYWSYWFDPDVIQWTWDQWVMSLYSKMEIARLLVMQPGPVAMAVLLNISPPGPGISWSWPCRKAHFRQPGPQACLDINPPGSSRGQAGKPTSLTGFILWDIIRYHPFAGVRCKTQTSKN